MVETWFGRWGTDIDDRTYDLSPDCTYSCGMSNGGYMSYSLACQHPDVFKAVGVVAGAMSDYDFDNCNPEEVIPIIHVHGTADGVVDYNNGYLGPWGNEGIPDIPSSGRTSWAPLAKIKPPFPTFKSSTSLRSISFGISVHQKDRSFTITV